jgi:hypothetical protein
MGGLMADEKVTVNISPRLLELVQEVITQGLGAHQGREPITPFFNVEGDSGPGGITVLGTDTVEEAIATARWVVAKLAPHHLVLAYDGFISDSGRGIPRTEALHLEAYERGTGAGIRFAQRYQPGADQEPATRIGRSMLSGGIPWPTEAAYGPIMARYEQERQRARAADEGQ